MNNIDLREYVKNNVISTVEVAEMLQITKTRVLKLVEDEVITPIKKNTQGMIFFRSDIEMYKSRKDYELGINLRRDSILFDQSSSTHKSVKYFNTHRNELNCIVAIYAYFNKLDAVLNNFYIPSNDYYADGKKYVECPFLVLRDIDGREMWLSGCNCGYGGAGPHGTADILKALRDEGTLPESFTDNYINNLIWNKKISLIKDVEGWEVSCSDSQFETAPEKSAHLLYFNDDLILIEEPDNLWNADGISMLNTYLAFIPNPTELVFLPSREIAKENGYFIHDRIRGHEVYNVIIQDSSGRQLWLRTDFNNKVPLMTQPNIENILKCCGVDIDRKKLDDSIQDSNKLSRLIRWLDTNLRTSSVKPIKVLL